MILIGLGSNLETTKFGSPRQTLIAALEMLVESGLRIMDQSPWYRSAPVPFSHQPWFINSVARVETALAPAALLALLHRVESHMGRERSIRWAARNVDLDLLAYDELVILGETTKHIVLPHPRLTERAFVLAPLADLAPNWRHPVSGDFARRLLNRLPPGQVVERMTY